jgi:hypothetical protein
MKFLATVLVVYILFLSMSTNCIDCCADERTAQQEHGSVPYECPSPCSPFTFCHTCAGFVVAEFLDCLQVEPQEMADKFHVYPQTIYLSPLTGDIWQPPEFI